MSWNLWNIGKVVTIDSGFSVSKGILAMREEGVFGEALIKPRGWGLPVMVPGRYIDEYFSDKKIGYFETLEQIVNGVKFFIHCQKEENYVTKIMSCHDVLNQVENHETLRYVTNACGSHSTMRLKYPEPISHHNQAKHWVHDTNNWQHDPIALSVVWRTKWWPTRQFTFLLEVAEANIANARSPARCQTCGWLVVRLMTGLPVGLPFGFWSVWQWNLWLDSPWDLTMNLQRDFPLVDWMEDS